MDSYKVDDIVQAVLRGSTQGKAMVDKALYIIKEVKKPLYLRNSYTDTGSEKKYPDLGDYLKLLLNYDVDTKSKDALEGKLLQINANPAYAKGKTYH